MTAREPIADFRLFDEDALLRGDDLDVDLQPTTAQERVAAAPPRRDAMDRRRRMGRFAFAVVVGAIVGLAVVSAARVLLNMASRLGSPSPAAPAARQASPATATRPPKIAAARPVGALRGGRGASAYSAASATQRPKPTDRRAAGAAAHVGASVPGALGVPGALAEFGFER